MSKSSLWYPEKEETHLDKFKKLNKSNLKNNTYNELHEWSVKNKKKFWSSVWNYTNIIGEKNKPIIEKEKNFFNSKFFNKSII